LTGLFAGAGGALAGALIGAFIGVLSGAALANTLDEARAREALLERWVTEIDEHEYRPRTRFRAEHRYDQPRDLRDLRYLNIKDGRSNS
jgi:hypothetical protein